ncbi:MAG: thiol:disulfide interchange protein DsbA/DsbL, partial [Gammaproteobacteria bacterium]
MWERRDRASGKNLARSGAPALQALAASIPTAEFPSVHLKGGVMFARHWWVAALSLVATNSFAEEPASNDRYQIGKHYQEIVPAQPVATDGKIEVIEVFWYGCPHCYDFEPYIDAWAASKAPDVEFRRIPAAFNKAWQIHAKAYYAAEVLGVVDKIHTPFFKALHESKRRLDDEASLAQFFAENGVSKEAFIEAFSSFAVDAKVQQALQSVKQYG